MSATAVISCPTCLRQYEIEAATDSLVAQCGVCKACFTMTIPRLTGSLEKSLTLSEPLETRFAFFREGCEAMAKNVCELLRFAGEPVTPDSIVEFMEGIPRDPEQLHDDEWRRSFFFRTATACNKHLEGQDGDDASRLFHYFMSFVERERDSAIDMLQAAFKGVLGGIEWPEKEGRDP